MSAGVRPGTLWVRPAMKTCRYTICDVFTDRPLAGNPLAVFTDARHLTEESMQALARETNYSETTFVLPSERGGHARVRIFTPTREIPFAGHPTLGTALVIGSSIATDVVKLELPVGTVEVRVEREGARARFGWFSRPAPRAARCEEGPAVLEALGVRESLLPVEAYENGIRHIYVCVADRAAVAALEPDFSRLARATRAGVNVFCVDPRGAKTRMFAPAEGILEDPATGSAAGPLALHLVRHRALEPEQTLVIEQGAEIGRPSQLFAKVSGAREAPEGIEVGGAAQVVARGEFRLPL